MIKDSTNEPTLFDPRSLIEILPLPEGTQAFSSISRFLFSKGEFAYDPVWRYVRKFNKKIHKGQGASVRIGEYFMGLRAPNRIPVFVNYKEEKIFVGKKLIIPFCSIRGIMAGHGILPWRKTPVFVIMAKVDGCKKYIPLHQCLIDLTVVDLADFLSSHIHAPLGIASNPLQFVIHPGSAVMIHSKGETPLYEIRGILTSRGPDGRTRIKVLTGNKPTTIIDLPDPMGWFENWGVIADDLMSILTRRARSKYGEKKKGETTIQTQSRTTGSKKSS
jgi:hypothetical protein